MLIQSMLNPDHHSRKDDPTGYGGHSNADAHDHVENCGCDITVAHKEISVDHVR